MSNFFQGVWDNAIGGVLRKPLKKALGVSDMQLAGLTAAAVAAPFAFPAMGAAGSAGAAGGASGGAAGAGSITGGAAGFSGTQAAAPIVDASVAYTPSAASAAPSAAGAGSAGSFSSYLGDAGKIATIGKQAGLLDQAQPIQGAQLNRQAPQFAGLLTQPQDNDAQRRQQYQQYVQGLLGGSNGRFA